MVSSSKDSKIQSLHSQLPYTILPAHMPTKAIFIDARKDDWQWAQVMYETSSMTTSDIAVTIGQTPASVAQRASRALWVRDKASQVVRMTAELALASRETEGEKLEREREVIERVNTEMQARVLSTHRADIKSARKICMGLFDELSNMMDNPDHLSELGDLLRSPNERGVDKLNDAYHRVISFSDRTTSLKKLGESLKTLIMLERQAFGIQGLLEDPEEMAPISGDKDPLGWDRVLTKFATVMAQTAVTAASGLRPDVSGLRPDVIDVTANEIRPDLVRTV